MGSTVLIICKVSIKCLMFGDGSFQAVLEYSGTNLRGWKYGWAMACGNATWKMLKPRPYLCWEHLFFDLFYTFALCLWFLMLPILIWRWSANGRWRVNKTKSQRSGKITPLSEGHTVFRIDWFSFAEFNDYVLVTL